MFSSPVADIVPLLFACTIMIINAFIVIGSALIHRTLFSRSVNVFPSLYFTACGKVFVLFAELVIFTVSFLGSVPNLETRR